MIESRRETSSYHNKSRLDSYILSYESRRDLHPISCNLVELYAIIHLVNSNDLDELMYDDYDLDYTFTNDYADLDEYYAQDALDLDEDYARDGHDYQDLAYRHYA